MLVGAVHGYRGLVRELVRELKRELNSRRLPVVATGGYSELIASKLPEITAVAPAADAGGVAVWRGRRIMCRGCEEALICNSPGRLKPRFQIVGVSTAFLALVWFAGVLPAVAAKSSKPNFVIILADDMGFSDAGCYGGEISNAEPGPTGRQTGCASPSFTTRHGAGRRARA